MTARFQPQIDTPGSLHDMVIRKITCKNKSVHFRFRYGYGGTEDACLQGKGKITIEKADMDSSCVLLLSKNGKYGKFEGRKLSLKQFIKRYEKCSFEILDELYGYHQVEYAGYLHTQKKAVQMSLIVYFHGNIVYEIDES